MTMSNNNDIPELSEQAADKAHPPTVPAGAAQPRNEAAMRTQEGLPPDTMILAPAFAPPPMRCPDGVWAMLVTNVDIHGDTDHTGEVALFTGNWVPEEPPADIHDGDLVVRLTQPVQPAVTDVEMLLAYKGCWQRVGQWRGIDDGWPGIVAPTAAAVMDLHGNVMP